MRGVFIASLSVPRTVSRGVVAHDSSVAVGYWFCRPIFGLLGAVAAEPSPPSLAAPPSAACPCSSSPILSRLEETSRWLVARYAEVRAFLALCEPSLEICVELF
jgi:hypothetical protein